MPDAAEGRGPPERGDLTKGSIGPTLLKFALPTLASSIIQSLNGTVNSIWVGRFLGESALAATSNANMVMFLLISFVFGFGMAATILIGQAFGRRDVEQARRVVGTTAGGFLLITVVVAAAGWFLCPAILRLLGTPAAATPLALAYLRVIFLAMPALLLLTMLMMALRGAGDSMTPLWFMLVAVVLDSGLNPVFIRGLGPAPRLGIAGSATATLIANYTALLALLAYIYLRDLPLRLKGRELAFLLPNGAIVKTIVVKGLPMGIQMIVISVSALALIGLVNAHGVDTAAAFGVAHATVDLCADASDGAGGGGERHGRSEYRRRSVGEGGFRHALGDHLFRPHHRGTGRATNNRRPLGHGVVHGRQTARRFRSRGTST